MTRKRPSVDEYFLSIADAVKDRSEDLFFQCGCVIVHTASKHIIATGFNGMIPGATEDLVDRTDREARRPYMQHAEKNAVLNCTHHPMFIGHCTAYVTHKPCFPCLQDMITYGIGRIVFENADLSSFYDADAARIENLLNHRKDVKFVQLKR